MNILTIISGCEQHREALLGLAGWEQLNFNRVRCYSTLAQVPRSKLNMDPMLVLLDKEEIGEEDCRFIAALRKDNSIVEIVYFSDTKDYATLSRALDLHFCALISWEDFKEEKFAATLQAVLTNFDNQVHQAGIIKRQLLRDIIKGKNPTSEEIYRYFNIDDAYASYIAFYIRRDVPVRILGEFEQSTDYYAVNWHGNSFPQDFEYIATVNLYMHTWCTLIHVKRIPSTMNIFNLCWKIAATLQHTFAVQMNDTVSVAFSDIFQGFDNFTRRVDTLQQVLDLQNYNGRSRIASLRDPLPVFTDAKEFMNIWRPRFSQALYENNADTACNMIDKIFTQLRQSHYARSSCLEGVCAQLSEEIDNYCRNYSLPTIMEMSPSLPEHPVCYSLQEICSVYKTIVRHVIGMKKESSISAIDNDKIQDIIKYIENNCETASVSTVAEHFHMSVDYLSHFFKNKTGKNLSALITEKKVNRSKNLLLQNKYKIKDVAAMVGFNSSQYFSTVFVKFVGMSPREYVDSQVK